MTTLLSLLLATQALWTAKCDRVSTLPTVGVYPTLAQGMAAVCP